jgi:hypothetical protein
MEVKLPFPLLVQEEVSAPRQGSEENRNLIIQLIAEHCTELLM